jgi:hypothetical protein
LIDAFDLCAASMGFADGNGLYPWNEPLQRLTFCGAARICECYRNDA